MERNIYCHECEKFLFETDKQSDGAAGAEAQSKGFVFKMPFLFTDKYGCLFFCDHDCAKLFYDKNIPKNKEVSDKIEKLKSDIPNMAKECCDGLAKIQKQFKKLR